jgi:hypothetical protein
MTTLNKFVKVEIGGEEKLLKYDFNATCDLEEMFNKGIAGILNEEQVGFRLVRGFYWAGLKWKDKGLTLDRVGAMLNKEIQENGKDLMQLMEPAFKALQLSGLIGSAKNENDENEDTTGEENPN